jgi:hypothetical protein
MHVFCHPHSIGAGQTQIQIALCFSVFIGVPFLEELFTRRWCTNDE